MNATKAAPVASTLSAVDFKARAQWMSELASKASMAYRIEGPSTHLMYKPEVAEELERLARQKQYCCSVLQFRIITTVRKGPTTKNSAPLSVRAVMNVRISGRATQLNKAAKTPTQIAIAPGTRTKAVKPETGGELSVVGKRATK